MNHDLAIGYIVCLFCGLGLGVWLLPQDIRTQSRWGVAVAIFSSLIQITSIMVVIVALAITFNPSIQLHWVDIAVACTLQSLVYTNLARLLRVLAFATWITLLPYAAIIVVDIVDVVFYYYKLNTQILYPILLFILTASPVFSACLSYQKFEQHLTSGVHPLNQRFLVVLFVFFATNVLAALCSLCGGLFLFLLQPIMLGNRLRDSIFLVCIFTQLVCTFSFCSSNITHRIFNLIQALQATQRPNTANTESIELVEPGGNSTI